jgi:hypothetical protein
MVAITSGLMGANVDRVTAGTTTDGQDSEFKLGTVVDGADGNRYRYVQAGAAISTLTTEPYALAIDENEQAVKLTSALALVGHRIGFAPRQIIADNAFFWARMAGTFPIRVAASVGADALLGMVSGDTAGRLAAAPTTASAGNAVVMNVMIVAAASASASAGNTIRTAIVNYPFGKLKGN